MRVVNYLQIFQMFLVSAHLFAVLLTAGLMVFQLCGVSGKALKSEVGANAAPADD